MIKNKFLIYRYVISIVCMGGIIALSISDHNWSAFIGWLVALILTVDYLFDYINHKSI